MRIRSIRLSAVVVTALIVGLAYFTVFNMERNRLAETPNWQLSSAYMNMNLHHLACQDNAIFCDSDTGVFEAYYDLLDEINTRNAYRAANKGLLWSANDEERESVLAVLTEDVVPLIHIMRRHTTPVTRAQVEEAVAKSVTFDTLDGRPDHALVRSGILIFFAFIFVGVVLIVLFPNIGKLYIRDTPNPA